MFGTQDINKSLIKDVSRPDNSCNDSTNNHNEEEMHKKFITDYAASNPGSTSPEWAG